MDELLTFMGAGENDLLTELIKENLAKRVLILNRDVDESIMENYVMYIIKWNEEDKDIPVSKRKPIRFYINSPGGNVFDGELLIDVMLTSKTPIKGVAFGLVASMAYRIFLACHERYAFKNTVLLQHDGEVAISNSRGKAKDTMEFFNSMEERTKQFVLARTTMSEEFYDEMYNKECYMYANKEGKEHGCVDKIIGEDCSIEEIF